MTTFFPIDLTCPVCGTEFKSQTIGSCGFASKRTDFRPNYWGANPVFYFYHNCPNCGFCSTEITFEHTFNNDEFKKKIKALIPINEDSYDSNLISKIERAMRCLELMKDYDLIEIDEFALANNWINAFWWANTKENEIKYGKIVLDYFDKAFKKGQISEDRILQILYLRGEINRRIGEIKVANEFFDKVLDLSENVEDKNNIASLAYQQKENPKENL